MEKIRTIHFSFLRADAHLEYLTSYRNLLDNMPPVRMLVEHCYMPFVERLDRERALIDLMHKSDYTAKIADADHRVDRCLVGMNAAVTAALHHFDPAVVEAAQSLHNRISAFGEIGAKSYEEETAAVNMLLSDLNSMEYSGKVALVGLSPWVSELANAEADFEQLFALRFKETSDKPQGRILDERHAVEAVYRPMISTISAAAILDADPTVPLFIRELNAIIDYFNNHTHRPAKKDLSEGDHTVIEPIPTQTYTEQPITPVPTVYYREDETKPIKKLSLGKDFEITYKNNVKVGMAEVTIHGKGAYKGQKTVAFNIARQI